jgi:hypothetical protein
LAEVVAINDSFLLSKKAESLWMPLHVAAEAANIEQLEQGLTSLQTLAGSLLEDPGIRDALLVNRFRSHLRLLKVSAAISRDALPPLETAPDGTQLFARERAAHKREDGWLVLTDKGVLFEGMVRIAFDWSDVQTVAVGGNDGDELGFQEGKRRTATAGFHRRSLREGASQVDCGMVVEAEQAMSIGFLPQSDLRTIPEAHLWRLHRDGHIVEARMRSNAARPGAARLLRRHFPLVAGSEGRPRLQGLRRGAAGGIRGARLGRGRLSQTHPARESHGLVMS